MNPFTLLRSGLIVTLTSCFASTQINATYSEFGAGCAGTGVGLGARTTLPSAAATTFGGGNAIPLGWFPNRYQQVFDGNELPTAFTMAGLSLRQPNVLPTSQNFTVDVEVRVGYTTLWGTGLSTTFANNWNAGTPVTVLPRTLVNLPDQPATPPTNPATFLVTIPWANTFDWIPQPGRHLLIEIIVYGNSAGGGTYGYPIDNKSGTYSLYGTPATATVANGGPIRGFGMVMGIDALSNTATPHLYSTTTPQINDTFRVRVEHATPSSVALMLFGMSASSWSGLQLPVDLSGIGAPGCQLLVGFLASSMISINSTGYGSLQYSIPNNIYLLNSHFYNQAFVFDPAANALGFVASNGGNGLFGNQ